MKISVEIEPPNLPLQSLEQMNQKLFDDIKEYIPYVEMISITNRPVYGYSSLSTAKWLQSYLISNNKDTRVSLHLTTRLSHYDVYTQILDAHANKITDILPILGHPRGPKDNNYFKNGFDILGFSSYLISGKKEYLSTKYLDMLEQGKLVQPISNSDIIVGNVIDINPYKIINEGKKIDIREKQIQFARKKEKLGAKYLISQGFYNADYYFEFVDDAELSIPVIPGILPLRLRLIELFGLPIDTISKQHLRGLFTTDEEIKVGNQYTRKLVEDLDDNGCDQVHIYSISNYNNFFDILNIDKIKNN